MAGIVTLNLNSAVWAKDYYNTDSKNTFRHSEMINGKVNTMTNDNGNTQTSNLRSFNCDPEPECRKTFNNVMDMLGNLPKATTP